MKDKVTRQSKGIAFVLYIDRESAFKCVHSLNKTQVSDAVFSLCDRRCEQFIVDYWK